jgi:hypothetical protein
MTSQTPLAPPQYLVDLFVKAYAAFVAAVEEAVAEANRNPQLAGSPFLASWQFQALPLLKKQNAAIQEAYARYLIGETQTIAVLAADRRHLAKELDGLPLNFAGPERAQSLDSLETNVVVSASRLCSAAGIL